MDTCMLWADRVSFTFISNDDIDGEKSYRKITQYNDLQWLQIVILSQIMLWIIADR